MAFISVAKIRLKNHASSMQKLRKNGSYRFLARHRSTLSESGVLKLEPSGDSAAFAALLEESGRPINEYAFGDIPQLAKTIDAVLAWDESHSNALTPHKKYRSQYDQIVAGLTQMRDEVLRKADSIRKTRAANGLGNRS